MKNQVYMFGGSYIMKIVAEKTIACIIMGVFGLEEKL